MIPLLDHPWRIDAACRDADPDLFFPEHGGFDYDRQVTEALSYCRRCPVTAECLELGRDEARGIWGGTTPLQRRPRNVYAGSCEVCGEGIYRKARQGPVSRYCSQACSQRAYKQRRTA